MFNQTNEEFFNDMGDDGFNDDVEEYVLRNLTRGTNYDPEKTIDSEDEEEYLEFEEIIADNPLPNSIQERISIPVPRGTTQVTKSRILRIRENLARRSLAVRNVKDQVTAITDMSSTNLEELKLAERTLENLRNLLENQTREYDEQLEQYKKELEEVNTRETFYRNELQKSQDAHRADATFWQMQRQFMEGELQAAKIEFEREKMRFMEEYQTVRRHLETLQDTLEKEREQQGEVYHRFNVAWDEERQRAERQIQNRDEVIETQRRNIDQMEQVIHEQEREIEGNEEAIHDLHTQMYELGEVLNENATTQYTEDGGSFMTRNWLEISGYRRDIGDTRLVLWNAASRTQLGRHYRDQRLEETYWVNWVKSNKLDQLALKHGILKRKGVGFVGYKRHDDRPEVISGRTAYNTIMQFNDIIIKTLNATQKLIEGQTINMVEQIAIGKAAAIYQDEEAYFENEPQILLNVKRAYEAYQSRTIPIEDQRRYLM